LNIIFELTIQHLNEVKITISLTNNI